MITIGFSSHRIESLPFTRRMMQKHDVIVIEEAPNPKFIDMLTKRISISEYVSEEDTAFPKFLHKMYGLLRELYLSGKKILQIEPYMEQLIRIHSMFSEGKKPSDVLMIPLMKEVYNSEREATEALLNFYESSREGPFSKVVEAVKNFARADAKRFRLRDKMRAEAIAKILPEYDNKMIFVEAGAMHIYLEEALKKELGGKSEVRSEFLLAPVFRRLIGKTQLLPPGDILTTHYIFCENIDEAYETLQAARSLIYILLLEKEEMVPSRVEKTPHINDEIRVIEFVNKLTLAQCEEFYKRYFKLSAKWGKNGSKAL